MYRSLLLSLLLSSTALASGSRGRAQEDVIPAKVVVSGKDLRLNGVATFRKWFFSIYKVGLYLETPTQDAAKAQIFTRVNLTLAAAWSPNPAKPPLYFDFPVENGEVKPLILQKWNANVPLATIDQYVPNLRTFKAIGIEVGTQDGLIGDNKRISEVLESYGIAHVYETYEGNHTNKVAERYETRVLPFFSRELAFE